MSQEIEGNIEADDIPEVSTTLTHGEVEDLLNRAFDGEGIVSINRFSMLVHIDEYSIDIPMIWDANFYGALINIPEVSIVTAEYLQHGEVVRESQPVTVEED